MKTKKFVRGKMSCFSEVYNGKHKTGLMYEHGYNEDSIHLHRKMREQEEEVRRRSDIKKDEKPSALTVSKEDDNSEKEAESIAQKVSAGQKPNFSITAPPSGSVQAKGAAIEPDEGFQSLLGGSKGDGRPMDDSVMAEMQTKMGTDFSGVKIHTGMNAHDMSESINAKAFTHGQDIYFRNGNYNPQTTEGKALLAHELVHTRQEKVGEGNSIIHRQRDQLTEVKAVKSEVVDLAASGVKGQWTQVKNRFKDRNKAVSDGNAIKEWRKGNEAAMDNLMGTLRWASLKADLDNAKEDGTEVKLPADNYESLLTAEQADADALKGNLAKGTKSAVISFINVLRKYVSLRASLSSKEQFFHQYDSYFVNPDVIKILNAETPAGLFTSAQLKAECGAESLDLTGPATAGNYIGIAGLGPDAQTAGISWAKSKAGVNIPTTIKSGNSMIDARLDPQTAIETQAAVLGSVLDEVTKLLGTRMPKDDMEKRKLVWARYNTRRQTFVDAVNAAETKLGTTDPVTFDLLTTLPPATQKYIPAIIKRL
ncbi:MAG TPA: DUF4157 domain-containing protein [Bacteroidia bacterium]|nr:DUF4157 domain-containing protein [Bacteroidia bacterium]